MALAQPRIDDGRLPAHVGADQEAGVGPFDPGDGGIEQVAGAQRPIQFGAVLPAVRVRRPQLRHQVLQRHHRFAVGQIAGNGGDAFPADALEALPDGGKGLGPGDGLEPAVAAHIGPVEALAFQPVAGEAGLVRYPLLVHVLVQARQHAHDLGAAGIDADVAAHGVHHVHGLDLGQLPRPRGEGIRRGRQRPHRAQVDHVARQLGRQRLFHVGADLQVLAAAGGAELRHAGDLGGEADAAGAVDAPGHDGLDQRPQVLVLHGALALAVAAAVEPVGHGLVLQVAFAALVADGAVQRVIDEQELHHPPARLLHPGRVGVDHHAVGHRHGAGRHRLGRPLHLHQAHAAVAGDGQAFVIAEPGNFDARLLAGLEDREPRLHLYVPAVDGQRRHVFFLTPPDRPGVPGRRRCGAPARAGNGG